MKPIEIPPFYVGQEVVANSNHAQRVFKKGDEFTVTSIRPTCCGWLITIGILGRNRISKCSICGREQRQSKEWLFNSQRFSPKIEISEFISLKEVVSL